MKIKLRCLLMTLVALSAAGCGMKGPLYMPEEKPRVEQLPAPSAETEQELATQQQEPVAEK